MKQEFNATIGLGDYDATESRPFGANGRNALEIDKETVFYPLDETAKWGGKEYPLIETESGIKCNAPYVANCMVKKDGVVVNGDMDAAFHCMHTPRTAKEAGLTLAFVQQKIKDDKFPKLKPVQTLPVAIKRADLIANATDETKKVYLQKLGKTLEELDCEYVPSYKKSAYTANDGVFSIKSTIVEIV